MRPLAIAFLVLLFSETLLARALPVERNVDVTRYVGRWYAHYSLPQFFTFGCDGQTADYDVLEEKTLSVLNTCLRKRGLSKISGKAVVKNAPDNSRFVVTFDDFFTRLFRVTGDYNIIKLDPDYDFVMVGSEDRRSLWLMSRTPEEWPEEVRKEYLTLAHELGFQTRRLHRSRF